MDGSSTVYSALYSIELISCPKHAKCLEVIRYTFVNIIYYMALKNPRHLVGKNPYSDGDS